jgi:hypothetical protein
MPEPSPSQSPPAGADGQAKRTPAALRQFVEEGAFPLLQERTQTQLGFINSLLITLAIGLLAFAANASASSSELHRLEWRKWLLLSGLAVLALSVLSGLRLAHNRLASHRVTTRVARLRQLRDRYVSAPRGYELRRLRRQVLFFETWAKGSWSKRPEKEQVHKAARDLAAVIPDGYTAKGVAKANGQEALGSLPGPDRAQIADLATALVEALRAWYEQADNWTWRWLRVQTGCFIVGAVLLLVVPISYY